MAWCYCIVLYCLVSLQTPASCTPMQPSCARPAGAQCSCRCTAHRLGDPSTHQSVFNGAAQLTQAVQPWPPAPQRIWMHLDIELDIELDTECRAAASDKPARAWPQGATWLYWLARASSLSRRRLSPSQPQSAHEWAHPMPNASRTEGFSLLPGPPSSYYHRPARPLKIGGVPLVAIAIAIPLDIRPVAPMGVTNSLRRQPFLLVPLWPRSTPTPTSSP
jgi:hypothetical protein